MSEPIAFPAPDDLALERLLDGAVGAFAIPIQPDWHREAMAYLRNVADAAHLVMALDLGDECDPAAVFRA